MLSGNLNNPRFFGSSFNFDLQFKPVLRAWPLVIQLIQPVWSTFHATFFQVSNLAY
jgi:uncharacterized membrane protein